MENVVQTAVQERRGNSYVCPVFTRGCTKAVSSRYPHPIVTMASLTILAKECNFSSISTIHRVPKDQVYIIQQRQLRKEHQDTHYVSALFRYYKEMPVTFHEHSVLLSVDDKHKIKVGEPGHPVAAVERGKKVAIFYI